MKENERKRKAAEKEEEKKRRTELRGKRQQQVTEEDGLQQAEISNNECAVCLGAYEDDVHNEVLEKEWIQCTNLENCGK